MYLNILDFDGVFCPNLLKTQNKNINTSGIKEEVFAEGVKQYKTINPMIKALLQLQPKMFLHKYSKEGGIKYQNIILTGRKESYLKETTEKFLIFNSLMEYIDKIWYYPFEKSYTGNDYFLWKEQKIFEMCKFYNPKIIFIYDDDKKLLSYLYQRFGLRYDFTIFRYIYLEFFEDHHIDFEIIY